jgi:hypothetical protein
MFKVLVSVDNTARAKKFLKTMQKNEQIKNYWWVTKNINV